jgi:hypothetical protein
MSCDRSVKDRMLHTGGSEMFGQPPHETPHSIFALGVATSTVGWKGRR